MLLFIVSRNVGSLNQEVVCKLLPSQPLSLLPQSSGKSSAPGLKTSLGREAGALSGATVKTLQNLQCVSGRDRQEGMEAK